MAPLDSGRRYAVKCRNCDQPILQRQGGWKHMAGVTYLVTCLTQQTVAEPEVDDTEE
jgi:hypothetical protein